MRRLSGLPLSGLIVELGQELLALGPRRRRHVADPPLADDVLGPLVHDTPMVPVLQALRIHIDDGGQLRLAHVRRRRREKPRGL